MNSLIGYKRNAKQEKELQDIKEKTKIMSQDIKETYKPEKEIAEKILGERAREKYGKIQEKKLSCPQ